jgi:hypothetical protein
MMLTLCFPDALFIVYNPTTNTTLQLPTMPQWAYNYGMTVVGAGGVLVCGGFNNTNWLSVCHLYTPATNTWTGFAPLPLPIDQHAMVTLGADAYVFGGENG